jgi:hypothetical protein
MAPDWDSRDVYVSAATVWEVGIKQAIGKFPEPAGLPERIQESGFPPSKRLVKSCTRRFRGNVLYRRDGARLW